MSRVRYGARTADELNNREVQATKVGAWSSALTATYLTDPAVVAAVLPPPLEPPAEPTVKVSISRVDLGRGLPPFGAGTFAVAARHGTTEGFYPLLMPLSTEQAVIGGRETFGEPKKLAQVTQERYGDRIVGTVARMGVTIIEIAGTVTGELPPPAAADRIDFYFKFLPSPDGVGFDADPSLVYCHRETETGAHEAVDGTVTLSDSRFDPVADLPVVGDVSITFSQRRSQQRGEIVATVSGDDLRPFVHQRYDDLSPLGKDD
jgi:acetoacetate decarboxylase